MTSLRGKVGNGDRTPPVSQSVEPNQVVAHKKTQPDQASDSEARIQSGYGYLV